MNIWIMGDSWGTPNYFQPMADWRAKNHISELLADSGHTITNFSLNGTSNLNPWLTAVSHDINHVHVPDLIIWIHTSLMRDYYAYHDEISRTSDDLMEKMHIAAEYVYKTIADIIHQVGSPPLIVIEGHGLRVLPEFDQHMVKPYHMVKHWREHICGTPLPRAHWVSEINYVEHFGQTLPNLDKVISNIECVQDAISDSGKFPDHSHPGDQAHRMLYNMLLPVIEKISQDLSG